jgi:uncharacterized damage-inducible protein DinB
MKQYILQLFAYETWANERIVEALEQMQYPDDRALELFSHLLAARFTWLQRITGQHGYVPLWEKRDLLDCVQLLMQTNNSWEAFLNQCTDQDFTRSIQYQNTQHQPFESTIQEIVVHLINHSTYHRGQIVASLKGKIPNLPVTDFIVFARTHP